MKLTTDFVIAVAVGALIFGMVSSNAAALMTWLRGAIVKAPAWFEAKARTVRATSEAKAVSITGPTALSEATAPLAFPPTPPVAIEIPPLLLTVLDPERAAQMTQMEIINSAYASYLKSLSPLAMLAWQSMYVRAAQPSDVHPGGAWLYDPYGTAVPGSPVVVLPGTPGAMVACSAAAQVNLIKLARLGAPVIVGVPVQ